MSSPTKPTEEAISQLLHAGRELHPPANAKNEARLKDFDAECKRAADDPEKFWAEICPSFGAGSMAASSGRCSS